MTNKEAINLLDNLLGMVEDNQNNDYDTALKMAIEALKQPESKKGRWINSYFGGVHHLRCPECGAYIEATFFANDYGVNFCPNCGCEMER